MNRRQRKKQQKNLILIVSMKAVFRQEDLKREKEQLQKQIDSGNVVLLPAHMHLEAIIQQGANKNQIIIEQMGVKFEHPHLINTKMGEQQDEGTTI